MKPRLIDRILLAFVLLIFMGIMAVVVLIAANVFDSELIGDFVNDVMAGDGWNYAIRGGIILSALILFVIAVKLMFTGYKQKEPLMNRMALLSSDENGCAYVAIDTIDSLSQKLIRANNRVKDCKTSVRIHDNGTVSVSAKLTVLADTNIPELCAAMRPELKNYIETYAGVKVEQVTIVVVDTYQAAVARAN